MRAQCVKTMSHHYGRICPQIFNSKQNFTFFIKCFRLNQKTTILFSKHGDGRILAASFGQCKTAVVKTIRLENSPLQGVMYWVETCLWNVSGTISNSRLPPGSRPPRDFVRRARATNRPFGAVARSPLPKIAVSEDRGRGRIATAGRTTSRRTRTRAPCAGCVQSPQPPPSASRRRNLCRLRPVAAASAALFVILWLDPTTAALFRPAAGVKSRRSGTVLRPGERGYGRRRHVFGGCGGDFSRGAGGFRSRRRRSDKSSGGFERATPFVAVQSLSRLYRPPRPAYSSTTPLASRRSQRSSV